MADLPTTATNGSQHLSQVRAAHREWIGGRAVTLLSHYWRHDDPTELTAAIGADWATILEGIPQQYIQSACVEYMRKEARRKPTPGDIYQIAKRHMPAPQVVHTAPPEPRKADRVSPDAAQKILEEAGYAVKRFDHEEPQRRERT